MLLSGPWKFNELCVVNKPMGTNCVSICWPRVGEGSIEQGPCLLPIAHVAAYRVDWSAWVGAKAKFGWYSQVCGAKTKFKLTATSNSLHLAIGTHHKTSQIQTTMAQFEGAKARKFDWRVESADLLALPV